MEFLFKIFFDEKLFKKDKCSYGSKSPFVFVHDTSQLKQKQSLH